jgi:hypothetical protein
MGPGVRGNPSDRSDPRRGGRREPVRAAGRVLRRGAEEWVDGPLAAMPGDQRRDAEDLEGPLSSGASRVGGKAREEAGKAKRPATQRNVEQAPKSNLRQRSQARFR